MSSDALNSSSVSKDFNELNVGNGIPIIKEEDEESIASKLTS